MSAPHRGMDWPTAWSALVPVYGLAAFLHAFFPFAAAPVWAIFGYYCLLVVRGARLVEGPRQGRSNPQLYLLTFGLVMLIHLGSSAATLATSGDARSAATALVTLPVALGLGAWVVASTAPPGVRDERRLLRLGVVSEILGALVAPVYVFANLPPTGAVPTVTSFVSPALTIVSIAAFLLASRRGVRRKVLVARKIARA